MGRPLIAAGLGTLLLVACGAAPAAPRNDSSRIACADVAAPHHAYVVVQHMSGAWIERCVGFGAALIDGPTIMDRSGIQYEARWVAGSRVVCQVDLEPRADRACEASSQAYWALFVESKNRWSKADAGFSQVGLRDRETLGLRYVPAGGLPPSPPPLPHRL